jgi:uncharacterized OsmC-like protein
MSSPRRVVRVGGGTGGTVTMELDVVNIVGDRHRITVRGHQLEVDQPFTDGGSDAGPTPTELFVASLASCVAHYARRGLGRAGEGPQVRCRWQMSDAKPWRVTAIDIEVDLPAGTPPERVAAVERAVSHCTVHNSIIQQPSITIASTVGVPSRERAA